MQIESDLNVCIYVSIWSKRIKCNLGVCNLSAYFNLHRTLIIFITMDVASLFLLCNLEGFVLDSRSIQRNAFLSLLYANENLNNFAVGLMSVLPMDKHTLTLMLWGCLRLSWSGRKETNMLQPSIHQVWIQNVWTELKSLSTWTLDDARGAKTMKDIIILKPTGNIVIFMTEGERIMLELDASGGL